MLDTAAPAVTFTASYNQQRYTPREFCTSCLHAGRTALEAMNTATTWHTEIIPAQLSYLAIYNPQLGPTDETFSRQLVFYFSRAKSHSKAVQHNGSIDSAKSNNDEALRQIGLAQGLVNFAR